MDKHSISILYSLNAVNSNKTQNCDVLYCLCAFRKRKINLWETEKGATFSKRI